MSSLLVRGGAEADRDGRTVHVTPTSAGWRHVGFEVFHLRAGQRVQRQTAGEEACVVMLAGVCHAVAGGAEFAEVGGRTSPFDGPPHALYVPTGLDYAFEALHDDVELAIGTGPVPSPTQARAPRLITSADVRVTTRGAGDMERTIHDILMEDQPAETLLVTEVLTPGGHWSSYPPHKHDTEDPPTESRLEELYFYRFARPEGFAFQRVYTRDGSLDESLAPGDGDVVLVPRGYHPVGVPAGYDCYYLNIMAGPTRAWHFTIDPDHAWLMDWNPGAPMAAATATQEEASV
jgi:5-deoxy-glucuronate isomerase